MGIINTIVQLWWLWLITTIASGAYVVMYEYKQIQEAKKIVGKKSGSLNIDEMREKAWQELCGTIIMMLVLMASLVLLLVCAVVGILRAV